MKRSQAILFSLFTLYVLASSQNEVVELTDSQIGDYIQSYERVLIGFYSSGCKYCPKVIEELTEAFEVLVNAYRPVKVAKINIQIFHSISRRFNVAKVPALIFFRNGEPFPITPPFDARNIISQVEELAYPLVEQISDSNDLKAFISSHKKHNSAVFVGFGLPVATLEPLALKYNNHNWFAVLENIESIPETMMVSYDFDKVPSLIALHPDEEPEVFYGPFEGQDFEDFIRLKQFPPLVLLNEATYSRITHSGRKIVLILADFGHQAPSNIAFDKTISSEADIPLAEAVRFVKKVKPVARRFPEILFTYVDFSEYPSFLNPFGLSSSTSEPSIVVWDGAVSYYKFPLEKDSERENMEFLLSDFLKGVIEGRVAPSTVAGPSVYQKVLSVIENPNFPLALIAFLIAMAVKLGRKGGNTILPKLNLVKRRRAALQSKVKATKESEVEKANTGTINKKVD